MAEEKQKKAKIYQIAKELNISHDTIITFLNEKGHAVKSHMSTVSDEMMNDIMVRFRKDKDLAVIHKKKVREFKEKYRKHELEEEDKIKSDKKKKESIESPQVEKVKEVEAVVEIEPVIEEPIIQIPVVEEVAPVVEAKVEVVQIPEPIKTEQPKIEEVKPKAAPYYVKKEEPKHYNKFEDKRRPQRPPYKPGDKPSDRFKPKPTDRPSGQAPQGQGHPRPGGHAPFSQGPGRPSTGPRPGGAALPLDNDKFKKRKRKKRGKDETKAIFDLEELARKKKKKLGKKESNIADVEEAIKRTFAEMDETPTKTRATFKKRKKKERAEEAQKEFERIESEKSILKVTEFTSVNELANIMSVNVASVIQKCIELGLMVSINQRLDNDTITLVADEFGFQVEFQKEYVSDVILDEKDEEATLLNRAPVVTIMGHVDHGKTSLLDYIRSSNVVAGEYGGITQHIGAYKVILNEVKEITFIDTPGHEAFTSMRARGAKLTDIVILVVAADDSVMPQTVEAISHALAANVPIIVAINKIDKPGSNIDKIKQQLSEKGILVEEWGGKYQCVQISAKFGTNVKELLEKISLEAEILDLKANPNRNARGVVIEAELDKGKGIIASVLVQKGTLKVGDPFIAGVYSGKVRAMYDERGHKIDSAKPSTPVQVLGFDGIPQAGDEFIGLNTDKETKDISSMRLQLKREQDFRQIKLITLDDISQQIKEGGSKDLNIIVKGDVDGSVEALSDSLMKLSNKEVKVRVIHKGVGNISESDILLSSASQAIIIGFHVRPNLNARKLAEKENVEIRYYNIIYDAINDVRNALEGMLNPEKIEEVVSSIDIREVFKVPKIGAIAGCYVQDGKINRNSRIRLLRDGVVVFEGGISSLKRFKDDVREVESGFECGIGIENFNDVKVGDTIEAFRIVEKKRKLQADKY